MRHHPATRSALALLALIFPLLSCASNRSSGAGSTTATDAPRKAAALERKLAVQAERVEAARSALATEEFATRDAVTLAQAELEIARAQLSRFDSTEAPVKLDRARLDLARAQDSHRESEEELNQLEMMYAEQDLADKTREIVLNRGRRSLERAAKALDIVLREVAALESHGLPQERAKLALDADRKARDLEMARRAATDSVREKRIALMSAESDLAETLAEKEAADTAKGAGK